MPRELRSAPMRRAWVLAVVVLAACGGGGERAETAATTATEVTTTTEEVTTTTERRPTTTTIWHPATTTAPPPTTPPDPAVMGQIFDGLFDTVRDDLIDQLEDRFSFDSLNVVDYDPAQNAIVVTATAGWGTEEYMADDAFDVTTFVEGLWTDDEGFAREFVPGVFVPGFLVTVDSFTAGCSGDFMLALADHRKARADWDAEC